MTGARRHQIGLALFLAISLSASLLGGGCGDCDLKIETTDLPIAEVGIYYDFRLDSDCGGDAWFLEAGNLPPGIELQEDGDLRGTPTRRGVFDFTVSVVDFDGFDYEYYNDIAFKGLSMVVE